MIIFYGFDVDKDLGPLWRLRARVLERIIALDLAQGDLRWAAIDLGLRSLCALSAVGREWVALAFQNSTTGTAADTTVAAVAG
jgi:hypothetical protein